MAKEELGLEVSVDGFNSFLRKMDRMDKKIDGTERAWNGLSLAAGAVGGIMAGVVSAGFDIATRAITASFRAVSDLADIVVDLGVDSLNAAIDYESAFAGVLKTTDGLVDEFGELTELGEEVRQGFRDLSMEIPVSAEQLASIGEMGGQLGIAEENLLDFAETVAAMGVSTNLTTEEAATGFARVANIMGTSQDQIENMGSAIVDLGNNFATTEGDVLNFALRIAGAGEIAGLTESDVFAIGAAMSSVGIQAEAGGTAVQKVLLAMNEAIVGSSEVMVDNSAAMVKGRQKLDDLQTSLQVALLRQSEWTASTKESTKVSQQARIDKLTRQIQEQEGALGSLTAAHGTLRTTGIEDLKTFASTAGLTVDEFSELWEEDAAGAFTLFVEGLGEAGDDALGILDELGLKDQRLVRSFLSLANAGDLLNEAMLTSNEAFEENTALMIEADKRYGTTESRMEIFQNRITDLKRTVGDALLPFLNQLVDIATPLIDKLGEKLPSLLERTVIPAFEKLMDIIGPLVDEFIRFIDTGGAGDFLEALGIDRGMQKTISGVFESVTGFFRFISDNWAAIATAGAAIATLVAGIAGFVASLGGLGLAGGAAAGGIVSALGGIISFVISAAGVISTIAGIVGGLVPLLVVVASVASLVIVMLPGLIGGFSLLVPILAAIGAAFIFVAGIITSLAAAAIPFLIGFVKELIDKFEVLKIRIAPSIARLKAIILNFVTAIQDWFAEKWPIIQETVLGVWARLEETGRTFADWLIDTFLPVWNTIVNWIVTNYPAIRDKVLETLDAIFVYIFKTLIPKLEELHKAIGAGVQEAGEQLQKVWEEFIRPALKNLWQFITESLLPTLGSLWDMFKTNILPILKDVADWITDHVLKAFQGLGDFLFKEGGAVDQFWALKDALDGVYNFFVKIGEAIDLLPSLPSWLTPGSPTPLQLGLEGINAAMDQLSARSIPMLAASMQLIPATVAGGVGDTTNIYNSYRAPEYNLTTQSTTRPGGLRMEFEAMAGGRVTR